jgi:hypothetical protein
MASIKIFELRPAGSELFQDSESFLNDLNEEETLALLGVGLADVIASLIMDVFASTNFNTINSIKTNTNNANSFYQVNTVG